ncbi:MAG: hypothetical protein R2751_15840 [Bacteroidales bacterium]
MGRTFPQLFKTPDKEVVMPCPVFFASHSISNESEKMEAKQVTIQNKKVEINYFQQRAGRHNPSFAWMVH